MNPFDTAIQSQLVHLGWSSAALTHAVRTIADFYLFKGLFPLALLWALWFSPSDTVQERREMVVATLASGLVAFVVGRFLAHALPFRVRPIYDANLHLAFPLQGETERFLRTWSSFPSDHAALWMAMAVGIFLVWRWLGAIAILQCALLVCFPRVYLGLHYPTDVIAGAIIGAITAWAMTREPVRKRFAPAIVRFIETRPAVGYMLAFVLFFELATMFDEPRLLASSLEARLMHEHVQNDASGNAQKIDPPSRADAKHSLKSVASTNG
nr:phosphatase PAP2 family protein [Caballeronia sp. Lep1P3]